MDLGIHPTRGGKQFECFFWFFNAMQASLVAGDEEV